MNQCNDTVSIKQTDKLHMTKKLIVPKGTKLPIKNTTPSATSQNKKNQKSSYLIPNKSTKTSFENVDINSKKNLQSINHQAKNLLKDANLNQINNKSSAQVQEMIDRFRFAKPMPSEQREKQTFWWNDDASTEFSDVIDEDENANVNESNCNFITNLKDLDSKARELIDKSEFTLSEKLISSEGLGSTSSATLISNSQISSTIEEEAVYKPDFVKYIETKNRLETDVFKINPNEDILQKWRLRRKLEESKSTVQQQNTDDCFSRRAQLLIHQTYYQQEQATKAQEPKNREINRIDVSKNTQLSPCTDKATSSVSPTSKRTNSISTMTLPQKTESAVQTSIDSNYMNDKPTKDEVKLAKYMETTTNNRNTNYKIEHKFLKTRKSSKSPTYKSTSTSIFDKTSICSVQRSNTSDLTKISSIYDAQINHNQNSIDCLELVNDDKQENLQNETTNTDLVVYNKNQKSSLDDFNHSRINNNLIFDSSYYESDELLNILFKKLFFINQN